MILITPTQTRTENCLCACTIEWKGEGDGWKVVGGGAAGRYYMHLIMQACMFYFHFYLYF